MFIRITEAGGHQYLQLVESFRNDSGKVRPHVVANLGRLDQIARKQLDPLINGLNRAMGRAHNTSSKVIQESGLSFGDVFMLHELWQDLGIDWPPAFSLAAALGSICSARRRVGHWRAHP